MTLLLTSQGINLIHILITAHFEEKQRKIIEKAAQKTNYPIVALADTQAILVQGKSLRIVGKGNRVFFNGFEEF